MLNYFKRSGIAWQMFLYVLAFGLCITFLTTLVAAALAYRSGMDEVEHTFETIEQSSLPMIKESLWVADRALIKAQLTGIEQMGLVARATILLPDGEIISVSPLPSPTEQMVTRNYSLFTEYREKTILLGTLHVSVRLVHLNAGFRRTFASVIITNLLAILSMGAVFLLVFERLVARHLRDLAKQAECVDIYAQAQPLLLKRKNASQSDELSTLLNAFNKMWEELQIAFMQLQQNNRQIMEEISVRRQAEKSLRTSEAELKKVQKIARLGSWKWHIQENHIEWSDEMYHIYGIEKGAYKGSFDEIMKTFIHPDDRSKVKTLKETAIDELKTIPSEYRIIWSDQSVHTVWAEVGELILDETGKPLLVTGILQDITERKQLQEALAASQNLVDVGTLTASIMHEIRSPLQVITSISDSFATELQEDISDLADVQNRAKILSRNAWRIVGIINSLLRYTRSTDEIDEQDINDIVKSTLLLIQHMLVNWSKIEVQTALAAEIPTIFCNRNKIAQVLINLLTNARDAMPNGGEITISTGYDRARNCLYLKVADQGLGIPEDMREKIFTPFFTTKTAEHGTGLGLSIVRDIVHTHGGQIEIESEIGRGTVFIILFPLSKND